MGITGYFQGPKFTAKIPEIKSFVRVKGGYEDIKSGTDVKSQQLMYADSNFFSIFSFPLLSGDPKTALLQPNSIVISEDMARRQFGTTNALGKMILLKSNGQFVPFAVTGVAKRCPQNSSLKFEALLPFIEPVEAAMQTDNWFSFFLTTYVVLASHTNIRTVEAKMTRIYREDAQERIKALEKEYKVKDPTAYALQPLLDLHLGKDVSQEDIANASDPMFSYILSGIAFFILFIACINFINLTVARSLKRAKEIAIRKVNGSSRRQLIYQFLGESFVVSFAAFILAIVIVQMVLPLFNNLSNKALSLSYLLDVKLIAGYSVLFIITGLLAGFYPALVLSGYNPVQTLYSRFNLSGRNYLQQSLVVLQFTLASFLIIATFIIFFQFNFLTTKELGYDDSNLIMVNKSGLTRNEARLLREELMKNPGISSVASKDEGYSFNAAKINGDSVIGFANVTVDESYIPLLKIPFVSGRNFSKEFPSDSSHSVIVNQTFVKKAGWKNPIGEKVSVDNSKYSVVGVVKDYHFQALSQEIVPEMFSMRMQQDYGMAYIKIKAGTETESLKYIEKTFKNLFATNPYSYQFKDQENLDNYEAEAKWKLIILFGAILTIFISCIGLFGLSVMSAERRTREIGIRKVLGASVSSVVTALSKDFLKLVIFALLVSIPLSWLASAKWLERYPYRITLGWGMFAAAGLLVVFIAMITISFQAVKTAVANPVKSLRME
jgi:putative ABC transport system permease protein